MSQEQHEYETVFILDPALEEGRVNEEIERFAQVIRDNGGTVDEIERWGRRRLAYDIAKKRDGVYTLLRYHAPGETVRELERRLRLDESVMRVLTVVVDPRQKEAMLAAKAAEEAAALERAEAEKRGETTGDDDDDDERPRRTAASHATAGAGAGAGAEREQSD